MQNLIKGVYFVLPRLDRFDVRSRLIGQLPVEFNYMWKAFGSGIVYSRGVAHHFLPDFQRARVLRRGIFGVNRRKGVLDMEGKKWGAASISALLLLACYNGAQPGIYAMRTNPKIYSGTKAQKPRLTARRWFGSTA